MNMPKNMCAFNCTTYLIFI